MIIFLRVVFIALSVLFSFIFFTRNFSTGSAFIAAGSAAVISFLLVIAVEYISHTLKTRLLVATISGFLLGLVISLLAMNAFSFLPLDLKPENINVIKAILSHIIIFAVLMFVVIKNEDIGFFDYIVPLKTDQSGGSISYKILDTSVIIDGRIADICDSGFLEGVLVIPTFVLNELQLIADSADSMKRTRGRRGLDILNRMQKDASIKVKISDIDFQDTNEVDAKLVKLAKVMKSKVITNDFNLNKVAEFHGVDVLNINELANALRPIVLPGEEMHVTLVKEGKDHSQAIGYLDDGTMVVVENGRKKLGHDTDVIATSVLQTTAGRMIFAKVKDEH